MGRRRPILVLACFAVAALSGCREVDPDRIPRIPVLPPPPPVPEAALVPLPSPFRVKLGGFYAKVGIGVEFDLPLVEAVVRVPGADGPGPGEPAFHVHTLRLERPDVTFPIDTIVTGLNFFIELLEPRVRVDTLIVEDGRVGTLAAPSQYQGRWLWRLRDVDLEVRDVALGGGPASPDRFRLVRGAAVGEVKGRPLTVESVTATAERTATALVADADADLGLTLLSGHFTADRTNRWVATIDADTFALAELHAFYPDLPEEGTGAGVVVLRGGQDLEDALVEWLTVASGRSRVNARGDVLDLDGDVLLRDVIVEPAPLYADDFARVFDVALPGGGEWQGWVAAGGRLSEGIAVRGALTQRADGAEAASVLGIEGRIRADPDLFLDIALEGEPLLAADTAFDVSLRLLGPADSLSIRGTVVAVGAEELTTTVDALLRDREGEPTVLSGRAVAVTEPGAFGADPAGGSVRAEAVGHAVLAEGGELSVRITADSLPLALVPVPEAIDSIRGVADGVVLVSGTVDRPVATGRLTVRDGGFFVEELGTDVDELEGVVLLEDGVLVAERLTARAGEGRLEVRGSIAVFEEPRTIDLILEADSIRVQERNQADVRFSADLTLTGTIEEPWLEGRVFDAHGWVREDVFAGDPVIDPDDPPWADLARRAPWPEDSRLRRVEEPGPFPLNGEIVVEIGPDLRVIDEDSDLYGAGEMLVLLGPEGPKARGVLEVQGGFYAFFGERFRVAGGAVRFVEDSFDPHVAIVAVHETGRPDGAGENSVWSAAERFPPLEFLAFGPAGTVREEVRRLSLFPDSQEELGELLIYDLEPEPVTGWRADPIWRSEDPSAFFNERAESQGIPLLWSYIADEAYDYIPIAWGWLQAGMVVVGPKWPAEIIVGPAIVWGVVLNDDIEVTILQPLDGGVLPGVRARWRRWRWGGELEIFSVPRFYADPAGGEGAPGFHTRRKTGVGVFWEREF